MNSAVTAEDMAVRITNLASLERRTLRDKIGVLAGCDEADLLAVVLLGD